MRSYCIGAVPKHERKLRDSQISFERLEIDGEMSLVFDEALLPAVLTRLGMIVDRSNKSSYDGIEILRLKRGHLQPTTVPIIPPTPVTVTVESWEGNRNSPAFVAVAQEQFMSRMPDVREIVFIGEHNARSPKPPRQDGKFNIFFWSAASGTMRRPSEGGVKSARKLWEFTIASSGNEWNVWSPSGKGIVIKDNAGAEVAELVGENLYLLYPLNNRDMRDGDSIFRRILEEVANLRGKTLEEIEAMYRAREQEFRTQLLAEARTEPVVVKKWSGGRNLREQFVAVAKDFVQPLGGTQIRIYDYCDSASERDPATDGRVDICIWAVPDNLRGDGFMPPVVFGAPLSVECRREILGRSNMDGLLIADEDDHRIGEVVGNSIYIHYQLVHEYVGKWGGKGIETLFRRILEEVVFQKTATSEQKAARAREIAVKHRAQSREGYVKACRGRLDKSLEDSRNAIAHHPAKVVEYQREIVKLIRLVKEAQERLAHAESLQATAAETYAKEFDKLLATPKIIDVKMDDSVIKVFTETLYCVDPRSNKRHEIGAFRIEMSIGGDVKWFNLTRRIRGYEAGMQAPHVFPTGLACLGNMAEVIPELVANYEFAALAMMAILFVESVNVDDRAGQYINNWPVAA